MSEQKVYLYDNEIRECTKDDMNVNVGASILGHVQIFDNTDAKNIFPVTEKNNLVVYSGREWLAQRALNSLNGDSNAYPSDTFINWFCVGTGGASSGDILTPVYPDRLNSSLTTPVALAAGSTYAIMTQGNITYNLKKVQNKIFTKDYKNNNKYLIAQVSTSISTAEANGPDFASSYDLNECGLYIGDDSGTVSKMKMFARCTFSTIRKDSTRSLLFIWNIYF